MQAHRLPVRWTVASQTGNDPHKPRKTNQDAVVAVDHFAGCQECMFMGVFDGHGPYGTAASQVWPAPTFHAQRPHARLPWGGPEPLCPPARVLTRAPCVHCV